MNSFGTTFRFCLFGESHSPVMGIVIDFMKSGLKVDESEIKRLLALRRPSEAYETKRMEEDSFEITSGVFNGFTTGGPIHVVIQNKSQNSEDYLKMKLHFRPGHADFVAEKKYQGFQDYRGGGFFSGRMTACLVIAGYFSSLLKSFDIRTEILQIGTCRETGKFDQYLLNVRKDLDSVGAKIEIVVKNLPVGLGEPFFSSIESELSRMIFSIPGIKGIEFGIGFGGIELLGSQFNDVILDESGKTKTNHNGGINGGISNGNDLVFRVFVKPTNSIQREQETYHFGDQKVENLAIKGRHDVCFAKRLEIVLKSCTNIVLTNLYLEEELRK